MTAFEDFVNTELPQRPVLIKGAAEATGDPRLSALPKVQGAPIGTLYEEYGTIDTWKRTGIDPNQWTRIPSNRLREGYYIYVDPITGSDDITNDGTITPLATIAEAAKRAADRVDYGTVILSAGTHDLNGDSVSVRLPIGWGMCGYFVLGVFDGTHGWPILDSFAVESTVDWTVTKNSGTTPWAINEHVGKRVALAHDGATWYETYVIQGNTEHTLTLVALYYPPDIGSTAKIVEIQTTITNGNLLYYTGEENKSLNYIEFDDVYLAVESVQMIDCNFINPPYHGFLTYYDTKSMAAYNCFFLNAPSRGASLSGFYGEIAQCGFMGIPIGISAGCKLQTWIWDCSFTNITNYAIQGSYCPAVNFDFQTHLVNVRDFIYMAATPPALLTIGGNPATAFSTKPTRYGIMLGAGTSAMIKSNFAMESVTPGNTFYVNGRTVSLTDMINKYQRNYWGPGNTTVIAY